jgi:hypothetical protein
LKFLALKKAGFPPVKNTSQTFFAFFFAHENIKKRASKVAHNRPQTFFHNYSPELIFQIMNMSQNSSASLSVG